MSIDAAAGGYLWLPPLVSIHLSAQRASDAPARAAIPGFQFSTLGRTEPYRG